jgi:hypothetical protein
MLVIVTPSGVLPACTIRISFILLRRGHTHPLRSLLLLLFLLLLLLVTSCVIIFVVVLLITNSAPSVQLSLFPLWAFKNLFVESKA